MELISCFKKSSFQRIQLGMSFDAFQQVWSPTTPLVKEIFSKEDNAYGCRLNGAEFMFLNDALLSVKIDVLHQFFSESKQVFNNLTLDKTVQQWTEHGLDWNVYRLYTVKKQIVLLCDNITYEFLFEASKRKFKLQQIRVLKVDAQADNRALIIGIQHENRKLTGIGIVV